MTFSIFWLSVDISIYGVNPEGGAAFLGEGRYEGQYSESNE